MSHSDGPAAYGKRSWSLSAVKTAEGGKEGRRSTGGGGGGGGGGGVSSMHGNGAAYGRFDSCTDPSVAATLVRSIKAHHKNSALARDVLVAMHMRLTEDRAREWWVRFVNSKTGGVTVLLAVIDFHMADLTVIDAAVQLLCALTHFGGKHQVRVMQKVSKRGGAKLLLNVLNTHKAGSQKTFQNACTVLSSLSAVDPKLAALSRTTGALSTLVGVLEVTQSLEVLISAVSSLCSLCSKCNHNPATVVRKGVIPILTSLAQRCVSDVLLRAVCKLILHVTRVDEAIPLLVRDGTVQTLIRILAAPSSSPEVQRLALNALAPLSRDPEGKPVFDSLGGVRSIVDTMLANAEATDSDTLLDTVIQLFRFCGITSLPIQHDEEVKFDYHSTLNPYVCNPAAGSTDRPAEDAEAEGAKRDEATRDVEKAAEAATGLASNLPSDPGCAQVPASGSGRRHAAQARQARGSNARAQPLGEPAGLLPIPLSGLGIFSPELWVTDRLGSPAADEKLQQKQQQNREAAFTDSAPSKQHAACASPTSPGRHRQQARGFSAPSSYANATGSDQSAAGNPAAAAANRADRVVGGGDEEDEDEDEEEEEEGGKNTRRRGSPRAAEQAKGNSAAAGKSAGRQPAPAVHRKPADDEGSNNNSSNNAGSAPAPCNPSGFGSGGSGRGGEGGPALPPTHHVRPSAWVRASPSCDSALAFCPAAPEELHPAAPALKAALLMHETKRLTHPENVIFDTVFNDIPRDPPPNPYAAAPPAEPVATRTPPLRFSSAFESGNLKRAIRIYDTEYDLLLNNDVNSSFFTQWFYFSVQGMVPGVAYKFNIINLEKGASLFSEGQQPLVFSEKQFTKTGVGWRRGGADVYYLRNPYNRRDPSAADIEKVLPTNSSPGGSANAPGRPGPKKAGGKKAASADKPTADKALPDKLPPPTQQQQQQQQPPAWPPSGEAEPVGYPDGSGVVGVNGVKNLASVLKKLVTKTQGTYCTLHFTLTFEHESDICYIAYSYPYTYSDLQQYLRSLSGQYPNLHHYMTNQVLCKTVGRNVVNLLTVTTMKRDDGTAIPLEEIAKRKVCFVSARVHPGESCSSWMMKGLLDALLDPFSEEAKVLRDRLVWKIVPMLNPDGVINGNTRCTLTARDLNREWQSPSVLLSPEIYYLKNVIRHVKTREDRNVLLFCDFHGHSKNKGFFMYGCNTLRKATVVTPSTVLERVLPRIMAEESDCFSYQNTSFKMMQDKERTGRVVMWREFNIRLSYTMEASMMGSDHVPVDSQSVMTSASCTGQPGKEKSAHFTTRHYMSMGAGLTDGIRPFISSEGDPAILRLGDVVHDLIVEMTQAGSNGSGPRKTSGGKRAAAPDDTDAAARREAQRGSKATKVVAQEPPSDDAASSEDDHDALEEEDPEDDDDSM